MYLVKRIVVLLSYIWADITVMVKQVLDFGVGSKRLKIEAPQELSPHEKSGFGTI